MSYDENGNWVFDPNSFEDQEAYREAVERQRMDEIVRHQQKAVEDNAQINEGWQKIMEEEGLTPELYNKLYNEDPSHAKDLIVQGMRNLARGMKKARDPQTGRFVKQTHHETAPGPQRTAESQQRMEELRAKANKGTLSESDELSLIDDLLGGPL